MKDSSQNNLLTIKETAEKLGCSIWELRYSVRTNQICYSKIKGRIYFNTEVLEKWINARIEPSDNYPSPKELRNLQRKILREFKESRKNLKRGWVK